MLKRASDNLYYWWLVGGWMCAVVCGDDLGNETECVVVLVVAVILIGYRHRIAVISIWFCRLYSYRTCVPFSSVTH